MMDSESCRDNAMHCIAMANNAADNIRAQRALFDMAKTWIKLADQAERAEALDGRASPAAASSAKSS
jgi:hypothetical protein